VDISRSKLRSEKFDDDDDDDDNNNNLLTQIGLSPGGSGYFTCIQNMILSTNKFKSGES